MTELTTDQREDAAVDVAEPVLGIDYDLCSGCGRELLMNDLMGRESCHCDGQCEDRD